MWRLLISLPFALASAVAAEPALANLIRDGDFASLDSWQRNGHLAAAGKVTRLPEDKAVTITNPVIDLDASLFQEIPTAGHSWWAWSVRTKAGTAMRASLGLVALSETGRVLAIDTPTRIQGQRWSSHQGTFRTPPGTTRLRVVLSVLDGSCSFADVQVRRGGPPERAEPRLQVVPGAGFAVREHALERPWWEVEAGDLDGDGVPELIACDVDGLVTVRAEGGPVRLRFEAGALVYQFATADLDGDGVKEILFSSLDPKQPVRAINRQGAVIRSWAESRGPERLATGDLDGDGHPEIVVSRDNQRAGSGLAGGLVVYDRSGKKRWEVERSLRHFAVADWIAGGGRELVVGGPGVEFVVYDANGREVQKFQTRGGLLEQFTVSQAADAGGPRVVALQQNANRFSLLAHDGQRQLWETPVTASLRNSGSGGGALLATGDFAPGVPGKETVVVALHVISVIDATGTTIYRSRDGGGGEYWESWAPGGINSPEIACWPGTVPQLFLSSSRFRHAAYYRLDFGGADAFKEYRVPDQEKHLETMHAAVKAQPARPAGSAEKIKVFMALGEFARVSEATLGEYATALQSLASPSLEFLVMYEASDLLGHERGQKMTTDQIVERARLLEKAGIPFGYFATHGGQVWLSREAIRRSKEVAPRMFRFLYIAENLETLYGPLYKDVLKWTDEALDFCAAHGMKMLFKEKHDVWGLLPSDPEVFNVLFRPGHREVTVPIWSTNQPFRPEIQLGGMLGLKATGLCREFGMSTQYWNWHEWGRYPRGIRDVSPTYVCPSDIILRLELMGVALGGTWVHIEGGQTYLRPDPREGVVPLARRHRDLVYELVRKNLILPGVPPANLNAVALVRSFHPALEEGKARGRKVAYPYYERNSEALRQGFIPARYLFEPYAADAFPRLAYDEDWNVRSCFPRTPRGWVPVLPPAAALPAGAVALETDGERVRLGGEWRTAGAAQAEVERTLQQGAESIVLQAPGTCLILQRDPASPRSYVVTVIDPGYLAPTGVNTVLRARGGPLRHVVDLVTGQSLPVAATGCALAIEPGAFRLLRVEL